MAITIEDISRALGISASTVSKALNDYADVSQETKERVRSTALQMGYHPNSAARNLRRGRTEQIGILTNNSIAFLRDYLGEVIPGAALAAEQHNNSLVLYTAVTDPQTVVARICRSRPVDGLVLVWADAMDETIATLSAENFPFVVLGRRIERPDVSCVVADNVDGAYRLTQYLISQGHRRIGFTTRPALVETNAERYRGYCQALAHADIQLDESLVITTQIEPESGYKAMNALLDLDQPPTAVFFFHDLLAVDGLQAARERGLRVPEDMAIAGFEGLRSSLITTPAITTVTQPLMDMGRLSVEKLFERIENNSGPPARITVPVALTVRASTQTV